MIRCLKQSFVQGLEISERYDLTKQTDIAINPLLMVRVKHPGVPWLEGGSPQQDFFLPSTLSISMVRATLNNADDIVHHTQRLQT